MCVYFFWSGDATLSPSTITNERTHHHPTNRGVEIQTLGGTFWTQGNERMLIAKKKDGRAIVRFLHRDGFWEAVIHFEKHRRIKVKWFCFHFYKLDAAAATAFNIIDDAGYTFIVKK